MLRKQSENTDFFFLFFILQNCIFPGGGTKFCSVKRLCLLVYECLSVCLSLCMYTFGDQKSTLGVFLHGLSTLLF